MPSISTSRLGSFPEEGIKAPVATATNAEITLSGEQTVNSVAVVAGDRVVVRNQTDASDNGIYVVSTGAWTRATDFNQGNDVVPGMLVLDNGNGVLYRVSFTGTFNVGVTDVSFDALATFDAYITNLTTVAENITFVSNLGTPTVINQVEEVYNIITDVTAVSNIGSDITVVAAVADQISALADQIVGVIDLTEITANRNLALTDVGKVLHHQDATARTLTIPTNATTAFENGTVIGLINRDGAADLVITPASGVSLHAEGTDGATIDFVTIGERGVTSLVRIASDEWYLTGSQVQVTLA